MPTALADKVKAAAIDPVGERREVSVLFVDVTGFGAVAHTLDSEDVYVLIDQAMRLLVQVVYKYEGTVDKFTGDGLMALFGAPVSHENDPERAVRAALEMQEILRPLQDRIRREYRFEFRIRIGINTGPVIAGRVGSNLHMEYTVIGDTVNLAHRLESAAKPGTILVSFETYQRTRPLFRYQSVIPLTVKGYPDPVQAFRPLSVEKRPGRVRGLPGLQVPMVGRDEALNQLQNALARVRQFGRRELALITGEAGLGKSRLVAEFRRSLAQADVNVYEGNCLAYAHSRPLWVVADLLRDILHLSENDPADLQREMLHAYLRRQGLADAQVLPYLANVLDLQQSEPEIEERLSLLDASMLQRQTHAALRQVIVAEAQSAPTILVFEDLHWVDPASREFVKSLIETTNDVPLMLILVSRDTERDTAITPLITESERNPDRLVDIQLQTLSKQERRLLIDQLLSETTQEAQDLKIRIAERAAGNPFYIEEIVRLLIDHGGLVKQRDAWQVTPAATRLLQEVPGTLQGLILTRFDRLGDDLRRTMQKASVVGMSFPIELLHDLNGMSREQLSAQLAELEERQFLDTAPFGAEEGYAFRHILIQEAVYGTLLKRDRSKIHEQVAHAIERSTLWASDEQIELLARHFARGPEPSKALPYLISAAAFAGRKCAYETAAEHYRLARDIAPQEPTSDSDKYFHIRVGLGQALKFLGEFAEADTVLSEALQGLLGWSLRTEHPSVLPILINTLREVADLRQREGAWDEAAAHLEAGLNALGEAGSQEHFILWHSVVDRLAWVWFRQGQLERAYELASSATLGLDRRYRGDPITLASLYNTLGGISWQWGNVPEAIKYVGLSLNLYEDLGYSWGMAVAYTNLGILNYVVGRWPTAAKSFERSHAIRSQTGSMPGLATNLKNLGLLRVAMGNHTQAQQDLETSLSMSRQLGDEFGIVGAELELAHLAVIQRRFDQAAAHIAAAQVFMGAAGEDETAQMHWLLALIKAERGDLEAGLESASQALQIASAAGLVEAEIESTRVLGALRGRAGDYVGAEALLRESAELCLKRNDPYRQGLALLELGRIYQHLAHPTNPMRAEWEAKGVQALSKAVERFKSLGAAHDLQIAESLLRKMEPEETSDVLEGERRVAAIVWLDLSPSPGSDEEAVFEALTVIRPSLVSAAQTQGGHVIQRQDGLTVVFGAPVAHEDDARRAADAAWQLANHLREHSAQTEGVLTFRLAVTYGDVVAGHLSPQGKTEFVVTGEPVREVHRLVELCPPGQIWVSQAIRAATDSLFDYVYISSDGPIQATGQPVSELIGLSGRPDQRQRSPGTEGPLVGREAHLRAMAEFSHSLRKNIGGIIWIEGPVGIGKSRLIREFWATLTGGSERVWTGKCSPRRSSLAFSVFSDILTQVFDLQPTDTPDQIRTRIGQIIRTWPKDAQEVRPYLEMLSGVRPLGLKAERLAGLEPDQLRQQTFVALHGLLKNLASERPLVILLDDVHWADATSAQLLLFLSSMVTSHPVLFTYTHRGTEGPPLHPSLIKIKSIYPAQTLSLTLDRLTPAESETLLSGLLPEVQMPAGLGAAILERSGGNPYYMEEIIQVLRERGRLRRIRDRWQFDPTMAVEDLPLPSSLEALIRSRMDGLPGKLRAALQCLAVVGRPCETDLMASICGLEVRTALLDLESRGMLRRTDEADHWEFRHPLAETVVYEGLLKTQRKAIHLKTAQALEAHWGEDKDKHAEELAHHYTMAEQGTNALPYLVIAGEREAARSAHKEAAAYFAQAAKVLMSQPQTPDDLRWRIAAGLSDACLGQGKYAESMASLKAARYLVETGQVSDTHRAGFYRRLGITAQKQSELDNARDYLTTALRFLDPPTDREERTEAARILIALAWNHSLQGHPDEALSTGKAALEHAQRVGNLSVLARAESVLGSIYYRLGEWRSANHHSMRAMVLRDQMGYTWGVGATLSNLGVLAFSAGHWQKAQSFFQHSLALRQELGDVEGVAIAHSNLGMVAMNRGELDLAEFHFHESLAVATPLQMTYHAANSTLGLARVLLLGGKLEPANEAIRECMAQAKSINAPDLLAETYRIQAEILSAQSARDKAKAAAQQSVSLATGLRNRVLESAAWRTLSECALQQDDLAVARESLAKAQRAMTNVMDELETGRVVAQAGRLSLHEGDVDQADRLLEAARETFLHLGAALDLQRVEDGLSQLAIDKRSESHVGQA
jgi:predicted ATPase/class 3 adenylate cyclase/Tfp pilus assembly protein PilF